MSAARHDRTEGSLGAGGQRLSGSLGSSRPDRSAFGRRREHEVRAGLPWDSTQHFGGETCQLCERNTAQAVNPTMLD
jgi:hypothetical protein